MFSIYSKTENSGIMVKRYVRRRRRRRRPRTYRSRKKMSRGKSLLFKPDYSTWLHQDQSILSNSTVADEKLALDFNLTDFLTSSEFTAIWDQYRILEIVVVFEAINTQVVNRPYDDTTTSNVVIPFIATCIDRDDASTGLASYSDLMKRQGTRRHLATQSFKIRFTPTRLAMVYDSPTTTGYKIDRDKWAWLDCATPNIPHYGLKCAMQAATPGNAYQYNISFKAKVQFRGRRH